MGFFSSYPLPAVLTLPPSVQFHFPLWIWNLSPYFLAYYIPLCFLHRASSPALLSLGLLLQLILSHPSSLLPLSCLLHSFARLRIFACFHFIDCFHSPFLLGNPTLLPIPAFLLTSLLLSCLALPSCSFSSFPSRSSLPLRHSLPRLAPSFY
ncbi:hypothetical protein F4776DRAFT_442047 [Hypoxylon sp. NC0597]|nr:hypothetical protein F4776DRAFT_442047 [Hypoxylon sp. NC0597]